MKKKSNLQHLIDWFQSAQPSTIVIYVLGIIAFFLTLVCRDTFIYIPSGVFYQYTIYFIPIIILFIIIILQKQPYLNYNSEGNRTWLYKQPFELRKALRLLKNIIQVPLITILIYYSIGVFASYFPQKYIYYAYSTKVTWKEKWDSIKRGTQYQIGTEMTDNLMPDNHKIIYTIVSGLNRNYFLTRSKTYRDMNINKKITILSKTSLFWGEYMYDIDYITSNKHYTNSTNNSKLKTTHTYRDDIHIIKTMKKHQKDFDKMIHQKIKKETTSIKKESSYPKLLKHEFN